MLPTIEGRGMPQIRRGIGSTLAALLLVWGAPVAQAGEVVVKLRAQNGSAVPDVALVLEARASGAAARHRDRPTARIEQRNRHFIPQLLIVQKGTMVEFPNNDTVSHQVYSFSPAKHFQLSLYKGSAHPPIEFDKAGLVVLGCNIHDDMIGYILVTDSPYFAQTDAQGVGRVAGLTPGNYTLKVWAPRIADAPASLERSVEVGENGQVEISITLAKPLLAAPTPRPGRTEWDAY